MPTYWLYQNALGFGKQDLNGMLLQKTIVDGETYACTLHLDQLKWTHY